MGDKRIKYLVKIQALIARVAGTQFKIRKWSGAPGTAAVAYAAPMNRQPKAAPLATLPAITFWLVDAYYLALERKFRGIFNNARKVNDNAPDFSFEFQFTVADWRQAARRSAAWLIHAPMLAVVILVEGRHG